MPEFLVELEGHENDLVDTAYLFENGPLKLVVEDKKVYLTFPELDLASPGDAFRAAKEVEPILNGAVRLATDLYRTIRVGAVFEILADGHHRKHAFGEVHLTVRAVIRASGTVSPALTRGEPAVPTLSPAGLAFAAAGRSPRVERVLRLLAADPTWGLLANVLDVIEEDLGGERAVQEKNWVPGEELRRFSQTANSYEAVGPLARHARSNFRAPSTPMRLPDAVALIRSVVQAWLGESAREV
jgi:hypothetical protein